ncbi:MAG: hypothetical protein WEA61_06775 [Anaerolineales bacterium]
MPQQDNIEDTAPRSPKESGVGDLAETQRVQLATSPSAKTASPRPRRTRWILASLGLFALLGGLGAFSGWQMAVFARQDEYVRQGAVEANFQFQLGLIDLQNGACDRAKERFIYVIELIPQFPGVQDQLIQASLCSGGTPVPAGMPAADATAEPTPTPDLRNAELIFSDAQNLLLARDWDALLPLLDTLRKNFPDFQPIEVDRMYYIVLRNRGSDRILAGDLERGIFDLNRAEQIGPLDNEVANYRQWAVWYITGQSFWEVDWPQAFYYFGLVKDAAPNLHDLNFFTAQDRWAEASVHYADFLIDEATRLASQKQWCSAESKIYEANGYSPLDAEDQATADYYTQKCIDNGDEPQ